MNAQILPKRRTLPMRRLALAAIGISFFAWSVSTLGADLRSADPSAVAPAARHATPTYPTDPPAINAETSPAFVDGLYKELMGWTPPPCLLGEKRRATARPTVRSFVFPP